MKRLLSLFVIGISACGAPQAIKGDTGDCTKACEVLMANGCPEAYPTLGGASCVKVCEANREMLSISCVVRAGSVDELRRCNVRCR